MIRIVATACFALTLLCPVICLAGEGCGCADVECGDHGPGPASNCEAMTTGAVVAPAVAAPTADLAAPAIDAVVPADAGLFASRSGARSAAARRGAVRPPPGARRQAMLQTFLF